MITVPNLICLARLIAAPVIIWLILTDSMTMAFIIFVVAGVSDAVDGFLARYLHATTDLGRILDPVADKVLLVSVYLTLGIQSHLPVWLIILVVSRDVFIVGAVLISYTFGQPVKIRPLIVSKLNTTAQISLAALIIGDVGLDLVSDAVITGMIYITATTTVLSGASYLVRWTKMELFAQGSK